LERRTISETTETRMNKRRGGKRRARKKRNGKTRPRIPRSNPRKSTPRNCPLISVAMIVSKDDVSGQQKIPMG